MAVRNVISTLNPDGTEVMGAGMLMYHYPCSDIMNGSLLTVEQPFLRTEVARRDPECLRNRAVPGGRRSARCWVHVDSQQDAVKLVTHKPYQGHVLTTDMLNSYAGPVVEQAINQPCHRGHLVRRARPAAAQLRQGLEPRPAHRPG
jgi:hypothetical protein